VGGLAPIRITVVCACLAVLTAYAPSSGRAPVSSSSARPSRPPAVVLFPRLEGVYRQPGRSFVVTYQGWWLDLRSQQLRQLAPLGDGVLGYGPGWQTPAPVEGRLRFTRTASGRLTVTGTGPGGVAVAATRMPVTSRNVRIRSGSAVLAGTVTMPDSAGSHPGLVIVAGSGAADRHFESISQGIYVSLGFAVLAYDKRGVGASTGAYPGELATQASITILARDAAAAARFLMNQPGIDRRQVGFDGNSQGGWVVPLAAEHVPGLRFAILIAAPAVTTDQRDLYASFSGGSQYVPSESAAAIDSAVRAISSGYNPAAALSRFRTLAIWVYGQLDRQVPVQLSIANLTRYHRRTWDVVVLPGGSHGLIATKHGLDPELAGATRFAGNYLAAIRAWVRHTVTFPR
jgi:uncharacterized protein